MVIFISLNLTNQNLFIMMEENIITNENLLIIIDDEGYKIDSYSIGNNILKNF